MPYILLLLLIFPLTALSQIGNYKDYVYNWSEKKPENIAVHEPFRNNKAIILNEENSISIEGGDSFENINVYFQKKARIKLLKEEGVREFSSIILPETYDPIYEKKQAYFNIKVIYFAARIIKPDGRVIPAKIDEKVWKEEYQFDQKYLTSFFAHFNITNLEVNDELEFDYKYEVSRSINWFKFYATRVFFHNELPKQQYTLKFKNNNSVKVDWSFLNDAEPDSIKKTIEYNTYSWHKANLNNSITEPGAKPYKTLPYCVYTVTINRSLRLGDIKLPYARVIACIREEYNPSIRRNIRLGVKTSDGIIFEKFIKENSKEIPDSLGIQQLSKIHNLVVDEFSYSNDSLFFSRDDYRKERLGEYAVKKSIREISRYTFYSTALNHLNLEYCTVYHVDSRVGEVSKKYLLPLNIDPYSIAIPYNGRIVYLHPKSSRFGYYLDELPFYWENSSTLFFSYYDLWNNDVPFNRIRYDSIFEPQFIKTPGSTAADNYRRNNILVEVVLDSLTLTFDSKTTLSGQYSTLIRGNYLYNYKDSTINPLYYKKVWDIGGKTQLIKSEVTSVSSDYPYKANIRSAFKAEKLITLNSDENYTITMKDWFNHIIYPNLDTLNRELDFYADFLSQDTYTYLIKLDREIELIAGEKDINIDNEFGKLSIKITQIQPNILKAESYFYIKNPKIPAAKIREVEEIFFAIKQLNTHSINIKLKN